MLLPPLPPSCGFSVKTKAGHVFSEIPALPLGKLFTSTSDGQLLSGSAFQKPVLLQLPAAVMPPGVAVSRWGSLQACRQLIG